MDKNLRQHLQNRNSRIIEKIIEQTEKYCPGVIDLIGISGSFQSGDFHEKSDLDLCIVVNNEDKWRKNICFILDDISYDIYSTPWSRFDQMLEYRNPYSTKLLELDIVYIREAKVKERYFAYRTKMKEILSSPFTKKDFEEAYKFVDKAKLNLTDLILSTKLKEVRYYLAKMLKNIEFALYMFNKSVIRKGTKRIPEEISELKSLPKNFLMIYPKVIKLDSIQAIKDQSVELIKSLNSYSKERRQEVSSKKNFVNYNNNDTYEKLYNDIHKLYHAAKTNNRYLTYMTLADLQDFFTNLHSEYHVEKIDLSYLFEIDDLYEIAKSFETELKKYRMNYDMINKKVIKLSTIDELKL
jgi:predicted nucleotidyltransferase